MCIPGCTLFNPLSKDPDLFFVKWLLFEGHAFVGIIRKQQADHLTFAGMPGYDGRRTGIGISLGLRFKKQAETTILLHATMA